MYVLDVPFPSTQPARAAGGWKQWLVPFIAILLTGLLLSECDQYEPDHLGDRVPKRGMGRMPPF